MGKDIIHSKTFWVNLVALIAMVVQTQTGFIVDAKAQLAVIAVINLILRAITKEPVEMPKCLKRKQ